MRRARPGSRTVPRGRIGSRSERPGAWFDVSSRSGAGARPVERSPRSSGGRFRPSPGIFGRSGWATCGGSWSRPILHGATSTDPRASGLLSMPSPSPGSSTASPPAPPRTRKANLDGSAQRHPSTSCLGPTANPGGQSSRSWGFAPCFQRRRSSFPGTLPPTPPSRDRRDPSGGRPGGRAGTQVSVEKSTRQTLPWVQWGSRPSPPGHTLEDRPPQLRKGFQDGLRACAAFGDVRVDRDFFCVLDIDYVRLCVTIIY